MKKVIIGLALGMAAGMLVGEIPQVKNAIGKGKKKLKNMQK